MTKTIIHVAQDAIRRNMKTGSRDPVVIVREGRKSERHDQVELRDETGRVVGVFHYSPDKPLSCGARVWLALGEGVTAHAL